MAAIDELTWQSAQGSPEFSCCMSNSALGVSTLSKWATFRDASGIYVNYYGKASLSPLLGRERTDPDPENRLSV